MVRSSLFAGVLVAASVFVWRPQWLKVEHVAVTPAAGMAPLASFEQIRRALEPRLRRVEGAYFWAAHLDRLRADIESDPRVKRVSIYREFPSRLRVEIEPRRPTLGYLSDEGRVYPLADDGTLLPEVALGESPDAPLVRGHELWADPRLRAGALALYAAIPDRGALTKSQVGEIFYDAKDGFKLFLGGFAAEVRLGESSFGERLARVASVLSYLDSQSVKGRVIDARFAKKVVVRARKAP